MTDRAPCQRCGQTHRSCTAHTTSGRACRASAINGTNVCKVHGGSAPQVKATAAKRVAQQKAAAALDRLGLRREGLTPTELLAEVVERAGADLEYAAAMAAAGDDAWAAAYLDILDRAGRVAKAGVDAGLQERAVQVQEAQAVILATVVRDALDRSGIDMSARQTVMAEVAAGLRALDQ